MKIIIDTDLKTDNVTALSATSEDAEFPAENLLNDFTTDLWRAAAGCLTATLSIEVSKGTAVQVLNTNAVSAVVTVRIGKTYDMEAGYTPEAGHSLELATFEPATVIYNLPGVGGRLWAEFTRFDTPFIIDIELTALDTVYAGIVRAGNVEEFHEPDWEHSESSDDYSIEKELNNGANYFRKRNVALRLENLSILETRANAFKFKRQIFDAVGPKPLAIRLIGNENFTENELVIFAKRISPPQITFVNTSQSRIDFDLKEVI
jgi:hypothetical protein